jgi:hypothetical protein
MSTSREDEFKTAVEEDDVPHARWLLSWMDIDVNKPFSYPDHPTQKSPLMVAVSKNYVEMSTLLVESGADINRLSVNTNIEDPDDESSPLHHAASWNNQRMCAMLLERGAFVDTLDSCDETALQSACDLRGRNKHSEIVRMLLDAGADPNRLGTREYVHNASLQVYVMCPMTPLQMACKHNKIKVVRELLKRNVQVETTEPNQHLTIWWTNDLPIRELIKEHRLCRRREAFAMASIGRLAEGSPLSVFDREVLDMILRYT